MAYGQTGSGKTYTMLGDSNDNRGILPRFGEDLFKEIKQRQDISDDQIDVTTSFFEIYNENFYDLLPEDLEEGNKKTHNSSILQNFSKKKFYTQKKYRQEKLAITRKSKKGSIHRRFIRKESKDSRGHISSI